MARKKGPIREQTKVGLIGSNAWPKLADWLVGQSNVRFLGFYASTWVAALLVKK